MYISKKLFSIKCYQRYDSYTIWMECKCNLIIIHDIHHFVVFFFYFLLFFGRVIGCCKTLTHSCSIGSVVYEGSILLHANENFNTRFLTNFYYISLFLMVQLRFFYYYIIFWCFFLLYFTISMSVSFVEFFVFIEERKTERSSSKSWRKVKLYFFSNL